MKYDCRTSFQLWRLFTPFLDPLRLSCDKFVAISFSRNTRSTSRSKHIDVNFFFVKEKVVESLISAEHTPTTSMLANPLTKGLPICVFQEHATCWIHKSAIFI